MGEGGGDGEGLGGRYIVLLTDKKTIGAPIRAVYKTRFDPAERPDQVKATVHREYAKPFDDAKQAADWLKRVPRKHRLKKRFRVTIDRA